MAIDNSPGFDLVDRALRRLGAAEGAPEAHGSLCGLVCMLGTRAQPMWVAGMSTTDSATGTPDESVGVLNEIATVTCAALSEGDMAFALLLPPDDRPLAFRTEALADWCAGFMHGLAEAAAVRATGETLNGEVTREIMSDLAEIARVTPGEDETDLEAEAAYTELVEFIRVSVQLVFDELYDVRQGLAAAGVH